MSSTLTSNLGQWQRHMSASRRRRYWRNVALTACLVGVVLLGQLPHQFGDGYELSFAFAAGLIFGGGAVFSLFVPTKTQNLVAVYKYISVLASLAAACAVLSVVI